MKRLGMVALLVFGAVLLSSPVRGVYAQDAGSAKDKCPFEGKKEFTHQGFYKKFGLTDQQKKAWEENKAAQRKQMKELFGAMKEKREALKQEFTKDKLDMKKINQINGDLKKLVAQKLDLRLQRTLAIQKILTPEQFKQFIAKRHGYKGRHFGWGHGMMGYGMVMHQKHGMMGDKSSMVATPDGGVIVMKRHSLCKYDKDLNLVKEIKTSKAKASSKEENEEAAEAQGEYQ